MSEHRGHLLPGAEDIFAARRGHCRTARRVAATHLPAARNVSCSPVTSGCRQAHSPLRPQPLPVPPSPGSLSWPSSRTLPGPACRILQGQQKVPVC
jgi:hypothetical protein